MNTFNANFKGKRGEIDQEVLIEIVSFRMT